MIVHLERLLFKKRWIEAKKFECTFRHPLTNPHKLIDSNSKFMYNNIKWKTSLLDPCNLRIHLLQPRQRQPRTAGAIYQIPQRFMSLETNETSPQNPEQGIKTSRVEADQTLLRNVVGMTALYIAYLCSGARHQPTKDKDHYFKPEEASKIVVPKTEFPTMKSPTTDNQFDLSSSH